MSRHTLTPIERFKKALKNLDPNCKGARYGGYDVKSES